MSIIKSGTTTTTAYSVDANTDGDLVFIVSESLTAVTVSASANVGIGTSSPVGQLDSLGTSYFGADSNNSVYLLSSSTEGRVGVGGRATVSNVPLTFWTADGGTNSEKMQISPSGNLGVGVTPSAWWASSKAIQIGAGTVIQGRTGSADFAEIGANVYLNSSAAATYIANGVASRYQQSGGTHYWYTAGSGTAGNTISFTQALSVGLGTSLALQGATSQAGTGITFPATQSASSNANTLDDYEEGTWTPTITGTSTNPVYTASTDGKYTKIGRMVYVEFLIIITGVTSQGTGNVNISGLPFSSSSGSYQSNINFIYNDTWDVNMRNGYTSGTIIQPVPNSVTQSNIGWTAATLSTGYFSGAGWYIA